MRTTWMIAWVAASVLPASAQFCNPQKLDGAYGFQLTGVTTISGKARALVGIGRLEFDGEGGLSGTSSVNFAGFYLGNPVTGKYQAQQDCTATWSLQDDSGAFQHFAGVFTPDLSHATFRQTDPGTPRQGTLDKVAPQCTDAAFQGDYRFAIGGTTVPMNPGATAHGVSLTGVLTSDGAGNLSLTQNGISTALGTASVGSDCIVEMDLSPPHYGWIHLRGVLVAGGKELLAIETDAGSAVSARFHAR